jgi:outer membrane protein assembly factor BamB
MNTKWLLVASAILSLAFTAIASTTIPTINDYITDFGLTPYYAQTAWPTGHRDSSNSGFVPLITPTVLNPTSEWMALDGASVLAAVTVGPEGHLYATTGKEAGQANLHAFDREGHLLWTSNALGSLAVISSPVVDVDGDLYLGDRDQLWAFHRDGTVKWVTPLTAPLVTVVLTVNGFVGGVANNGQILFFDRSSGALMTGPFSLPAGVPLPPQPPPPGLWQGLMDSAIIPGVFAGAVGTGSQVVNTPAVNPLNNRLFITAAGPLLGGVPTGRLYGIDISATGNLSLTFTGIMGPGSGTSPVISLDGAAVYVADGRGNLMAFDALANSSSALPLWTLNIGTGFAAPSLGPDGTIYMSGAGKVHAIAPNGLKRWEQSFDAQAQMILPVINETAAPRKGQSNSVISVSPRHVYIAASLGYQLTLSTGTVFLIPAKSTLFVLDPETGEFVSPPSFLRDTSEGFVTMAADGRMYITHGASLTSLAVYGVIPSLPASPLKTALSQAVLQPVGGVSAFSPVSLLDLAKTGIEWVQDLDAAALTSLNIGTATEIDNAYTHVRRGVVQLDATRGSINDAAASGEIDAQTKQRADHGVRTAQGLLDTAKKQIGKARTHPNHGLLVAAQNLIRNADQKLGEVLVILSQGAL